MGDLYIMKDTIIENIGGTDSSVSDGKDDPIDVVSMSDSNNAPKLKQRLKRLVVLSAPHLRNQMISLIVLHTRVV